MHPWTRPPPDPAFAPEAARLLVDLRAEVARNGGRAVAAHFEARALWTHSWRAQGQARGLHRTTLHGTAGPSTKCVWCEQLRERTRELDVEHFRPKVCATEWQGTPPLIADHPPREVNERGGYWWLAFAWSNFALSCKTCNQGWKRNLFPLRTPRSRDEQEGDERTEVPLLLDPSTPFHVADHFRWTPGGIMEPVSDEGSATIVVCGLNRAELLARRALVAQDVLRYTPMLKRAIRRHDPAAGREPHQALAALGSITAEFTGMVRWLTEQHVGRAWTALGFAP